MHSWLDHFTHALLTWFMYMHTWSYYFKLVLTWGCWLMWFDTCLHWLKLVQTGLTFGFDLRYGATMCSWLWLRCLMESLFAHTYLVHLCCTHWSFTSGRWLVDSLTHEKLVDLHTYYLFGTHWCFTSGWWVVDSFTYALLLHLHRGSCSLMLVLCQAYFSFDVVCITLH